MKDHITIAAQYQADVLAGTIPACKWVRLACQRNRRDLDRQSTLGFPYVFNPDAGRRICAMAEMLPHIKGPKAFVVGKDAAGRALWNPIDLEPWQCWLLTTIFGWMREDGLRRFRVAFTLVPRKNAKSTIAAICALYMLTADGESGAECYSAATTRDQAKIIAAIAWEMARRSWSFREYFGLKIGSKTTRTLEVTSTASVFTPLSADASSLDGLNVSFAAIDEFHAHKTRGVYDVLDTATGTRLQPMLFPITTAGVEIGGICHEQLQYLERILEGVIEDDTWFGVNWTIDKGDDINDEAIQRKANPNYGVSVRPDDLSRKILKAQHSPSALNNVLTKHFNVWIRTESAWMGADLWNTCAVPGLNLDDFKGFPCWIGVDLAEVRDAAAIAVVFRLAPERYAMTARIYMPKETIARSPIAQMPGWVAQKHLIATDGNQADFGRIEEDIINLCARFTVKQICFDRALAAHMLQDLKKHFEPAMGRDMVESFVITVDQNVKTMHPAMQLTEKLVLAKHLQHDGNPFFAWMIQNVVTDKNHLDEGLPRKAGGKNSPHKIDGPVAMFTALSQILTFEANEPQYQFFVVGGAR